VPGSSIKSQQNSGYGAQTVDFDRKSFLIIYKGFIRPHLEYAIQTWCPD